MHPEDQLPKQHSPFDIRIPTITRRNSQNTHRAVAIPWAGAPFREHPRFLPGFAIASLATIPTALLHIVPVCFIWRDGRVNKLEVLPPWDRFAVEIVWGILAVAVYTPVRHFGRRRAIAGK